MRISTPVGQTLTHWLQSTQSPAGSPTLRLWLASFNDMRGSPFCDALLTPTPGELTFSINRRLLTAGFAVTDEEVRGAMRFTFEHLKLVAEPGGAVALAALLAQKYAATNRVVGVVLSGGNVNQ